MPKNSTKHFTTISDVAKYAQVGKTSVSRYLNGEQDKLSQPLQDKISQAIAALDYRPNNSARMLRAGQSKLIGLMLADVTNPYSIEVLQGIEKECRQQGYMLMVCNTDNQQALQNQYLSLLDSHRVDGIIVNTIGLATQQVDVLKKVACPIVLIDRIDMARGIDSVGLDNEQAATDAVHYLAEQAYQAVLVISEPLTIAPRQARVQAVQDYAKTAPYIDWQTLIVEKTERASLSQHIRTFVDQYPNSKVAIFSTNGVTTMAVAKACKALHLQVGRDIGLIAIDDPEWAQLFEGGISVMKQPTQHIGQQACQQLLSRIHGNQEAPKQVALQAELVLRQSC
ncbi:LacI family DNA-binding transcriptional regulator [Marinomonas epiphytica]